MAKDVTLADIAADVGVSVVAVSKALSGKPGVSDEMRNRIKMVAERLGYIYGKGSGAKTGNIGIIIPEHYYGYSVSFYRQLYECVVKALYDAKYFGILELLTKEDEQTGKIPMVMQDGKVDGLIILGQMDVDYVKTIIEQTELPICFLDTYLSAVAMDTVISDGYHGTYTLTNYLIKNGHEKIAFVGNPDATSSIADRFWGYRRALREHGIVFQDEWEISDCHETGSNFELNLEHVKDVDAYVCNSDYVAYRLIQKLQEAGVSVPEDVSVVGFDDFLPIGMEESSITTYGVDMVQMAKTCVDVLDKKIKGEAYTQGIQVVTGKMIIRNTVKTKSE